jgi:CheY-like chemotaxis protein
MDDDLDLDDVVDDDDEDDGLLTDAAEKVGGALGSATRTVVDATQGAAGAATTAAAAAAAAAGTAAARTAKPRRAVRRTVKRAVTRTRRQVKVATRRVSKALAGRGRVKAASAKGRCAYGGRGSQPRQTRDRSGGISRDHRRRSGQWQEALRRVETDTWDIVILDLSLPGMNGLDIIPHVHRMRPDTRVLIMSMHPSQQFARRATAAGAVGYIEKSAAPEEMLRARRRS